MRKLFLFVCAMTLGHLQSEAQNTVLAGKIVDKNGKPVANALISAEGKAGSASVKSDANGLYYSKSLPAGKYAVKAVTTDGVTRSRKVRLRAADGSANTFYVLTSNKKSLKIRQTSEDVIAAAQQSQQVEALKSPFPSGTFQVRKAGGKVSPGDGALQMGPGQRSLQVK